MQKNEILKAYGENYQEMTRLLLTSADLFSVIKEKAEKIKKGLDGLTIAIKPNLVSPTPAFFGATTHPEIVEGIIVYLKENGINNIVISEGSWVGDKTEEAFEYCGYNELSRKYGIKLIDNQKEKSYSVNVDGKELKICECYKSFDFLINVPVLKGHCQTKVTCALKNMKGLIPNAEKRHFHTMGLHKPIAHLNSYIYQDFIVVDHICGDPSFEDGGHPVTKNCIMVAKDPVLMDVYAAKTLGYNASDVPYIGFAEKLNVGSANIESAIIKTVYGNELEENYDVNKHIEVNYAIDEVDSCSACYASLIGALEKLKQDGLLEKLETKIAIGQGYKNKTGLCGVGNCTKNFKFNIPGCPPSADEIYNALRKKI